jgi:hypothetical protein
MQNGTKIIYKKSRCHFNHNYFKTGYINGIPPGVESTLTGLLGREVAETKKEMTWDEVVSSNERLDPKLNLAQFNRR